MADIPDAPVYQVPHVQTQDRAQTMAAARAERAGLLLNLLALVPADRPQAQTHAMGWILELERLNTDTEATLRQLWLQTVQSAYLAGRVEMATEQLRSLTGEQPPAPPDDEPQTMH